MRVLHLAWLLCLGLVMGEVQNLRGAQAPEGKTTETSEAEKESTQDVGAVAQEAKETPTPTQKEPEVGAVAKEPAEPVKGEQSPVPESSPEAHAKPVAKGSKPPKDAPPMREVVYVPVVAWEGDYEDPYDAYGYDPYDSDEALDDPLTEYAPDFDPDVDEAVEEVTGTDGKGTDGKEAAVAATATAGAAAGATAVTAARAEKLRWGRRPIRRWGRRPYRRPIYRPRPWYRPRPYWRPRPYYRPRYCLKWAWGRCVWWGR